MPTLPAGGYNYPQAPSVNPANDAGTPYASSAAATPEAFGSGIGTALSRLSANADQAAASFGRIQAFHDELAASDATNKAEERVRGLLYGDPNTGAPGYLGLRGDQALHAYPVVRKQIDQALQEQRSVLQNPTQQLKFDEASRRFKDWTLSTVGRHQDAEFGRYQEQTFTATQKNNASRVGASAADGDQNQFDLNLRKSLDDNTSQARALGLPQELIDQQNQQITSHGVESWAEGLAARGKPLEAMGFIEQNRSRIGAEKYETLTKRYKSGADEQQTIQDVAGATGGGSNLVRGGAVQGRISDPRGMVPFIRETAQKYGHDPDIAVAVARSEGLGSAVGDRGTSFGAFQLHIGGGLGDEFRKETGLDPSDPKNEKATIDFALRNLDRTGWTPYHGARGAGIGPRQGIGVASAGVRQAPTTGTMASSQLLPEEGNFSGGTATPVVAFGDSLAAHVIRKSGVGGQESGKVGTYNSGDTAVAGYNPSEVLNVIQQTPDSAVAGKAVVLSTGTSNDPTGKFSDLIPAQIALLRSKGATSVTVMGVGPALGDGRNQALARIAQDNGAAFSGPLRSPGGDGIHSTNQNAEMAAVRSAMPNPATPPAPTNNPAIRPDTAVPGLQGQLNALTQRAQDEGWAPERLMRATDLLRKRQNNDYTDAQRVRQEADRAKAEAEETARNEIIKDKYSGSPRITAQQIANDPRLSPQAKEHMIGFIKPDKDPVDPTTSAVTKHNLFGDILNGKITTTQPLVESYNAGQLSVADFKELSKQVDDVKTPEGLKVNTDISKLIAAVKPMITHSNPLMGTLDHSGELALGAFEEDIRRSVEIMRKNGKSPAEIGEFLSAKRFMSDPTLLAPYMKSAQKSQDDMERMTGTTPAAAAAAAPARQNEFYAPIPPVGAPAASPAAPAAPATAPQATGAPRQPGETAQQYLDRMQGAGASRLPGLPTKVY